MIVVYRYSDGSQPGAVPKTKLPLATKQNCFLQFLDVFSPKDHHIIVVADNVSDESMMFLAKYVSPENIVRTTYKSGAISFLYGVQVVLSLPIPDDSIIYLVEDDYVHALEAPRLLTEGVAVADYATLYDHPDKYMGEIAPCHLIKTASSHWRTTPSTTMTFATTKRVLREDWDIYWEHCKSGYPYDHEMFLSLGKKNRHVISCVPGKSTHAEMAWLSPFHDWHAQLLALFPNYNMQ